MKKVSIIVPVYNVEIYLENCINSLIRQSYENIEIILINDGSTDKSLDICNSYKSKDNRIFVLSQPNSGVSYARNLGLKSATGEYILFVDSDDFVNENFVQKMVESMENVDMTICAYLENYKNDNIEHRIIENETVIDNVSAINKMFNRTYYGGYIWNKIFRKSIIEKNKIEFDSNIHMCEDLLFVSKYMCKCKLIKVIPDLLYNYRMRESSAVWNKKNKKYESLFISYNELYILHEQNNIKLDYLKYEILNSIYSNNIKIKSIKKYLKYDISKSYKYVILSKSISRNKKINLFIKKNFNIIYRKYMNKKIKKLEMYK